MSIYTDEDAGKEITITTTSSTIKLKVAGLSATGYKRYVTFYVDDYDIGSFTIQANATPSSSYSKTAGSLDSDTNYPCAIVVTDANTSGTVWSWERDLSNRKSSHFGRPNFCFLYNWRRSINSNC